ncbi:hypothetical protein M2146_001112 [Lachnospiraceae bacterium PF1-22]
MTYFDTVAGHRFTEATLPALIEALEKSTETQAELIKYNKLEIDVFLETLFLSYGDSYFDHDSFLSDLKEEKIKLNNTELARVRVLSKAKLI